LTAIDNKLIGTDNNLSNSYISFLGILIITVKVRINLLINSMKPIGHSINWLFPVFI